MKLISIFLQIIFSFSLFGQTLTAKFSADNCYAVYTGNRNSTSLKVMPSGSQNSIVNGQANQIFNATVKSNITYSPGDYLYVIAWADDKACQGLIGEFTALTTIKTGDSGWEVYPTGKDFTISNAPNKVLIDQMIAQANSGNKWVQPFVGATNLDTKNVCPQYSSVSKVQGISDNCKWIWHNTGRHNDPKAPFAAFNHDEFLIFRFPIALIDKPKPSVVDNCDCIPENLYNTNLTAALFEPRDFAGQINNFTYKVKYDPSWSFGELNKAWNNWINLKYGMPANNLKHVVHQYMLFEITLNTNGTIATENKIDEFWSGPPNGYFPYPGAEFDVTLNSNKNYLIRHGVYYGGIGSTKFILEDGCGWKETRYYLSTSSGETPKIKNNSEQQLKVVKFNEIKEK